MTAQNSAAARAAAIRTRARRGVWRRAAWSSACRIPRVRTPHRASRRRQALIVALSHQAGAAPGDEAVLPELAALGAVSCGTDTADDGRRVWAVLDL